MDGSDGPRGDADANTDAGGPLDAPEPHDGPRAVAKNYELTGSIPTLKAAIATKPGSLTYAKVVIHDQFLAESCAIGDYNNDGVPDVSSGRTWYEGSTDPATTFKVTHAFRDGHGALPATGAAVEFYTGVSDDWADYPVDVDGDGWTDIINVAQPSTNEVQYTNPKIGTVQAHATAFWYRNPGPDLAGDPLWSPSLMASDVAMEQHGLVDVDGDGFPELLGGCKQCLPYETKGYYQRSPASPTLQWSFHSVTIAYTFPDGLLKLNGIGAGDVDGDGRPDLLERGGVWLQQAGGTWNQTVCTGRGEPAGCGWIKQGTPLLPTGIYDGRPDVDGTLGPSHIYAADMDGDGLTDLVAAEYAYGVGLSWYRQTEGMKFTKYPFLGGSAATNPEDVTKYGAGFTVPTALQVVDMDGDGAPDVVTGKMRFAKPLGYALPDPQGTPFLYVFKNVRGKTGPAGGPITLEPHKIDGDPFAAAGTPAAGMGVGRQIAIGHVNTDGVLDICVASKVGLAVFLGQ